MNDDLVSVIMPVYNSEIYLPEAIDSVLRQTHENLELILIDDGSEDSSGELIKKYSDNRIRYFHQENQGQSVARNLGIKESKGKFIAFLDSDDVWNPNKLVKQLSILVNSGAGLVYSKYKYIGEDLGLKAKVQPQFHRGDVWSRLVTLNFLCCSSVVINKQCFSSEELFFKEDRLCEDWDLWLRLSENCQVEYIDEDLVSYRIHTMGSSQNIDRMYKGRMSCLADCQNRLEKRAGEVSKKQLLVNAYFLQYLIYGHELLDQRRYKKACLHFFYSFKLKPFSLRVYYAWLKTFSRALFSRSSN